MLDADEFCTSDDWLLAADAADDEALPVDWLSADDWLLADWLSAEADA